MSRAHLPAGITVRADRGTYLVRVTHEGKRISLGTFRTLGRAEQALKQARKEIELGIFTPPAQARAQAEKDLAHHERLIQREKTTVSAWAARWLAALAEEGRAPSTILEYRSKLTNHILPYLGTHILAALEREDFATFIAATRAKRQSREIFIVTRALFNAAVKEGLIEVSPLHVTIPRKARGSHSASDILTPAEVTQVASLMPERLQLAVYLAAWCALRQGEVLGLQRRDFNLEAGTVRIERQWQAQGSEHAGGKPGYREPKTSAGVRTLTIPASLLPVVRAHLDAFVKAAGESVVFESEYSPGKPVSQSSFDRQWRLARDQVRPGFRFHNLRHTGLTLYAQQGATLEELRVRAGHSDIDAVLRYQHATLERDRALVAKLDGLLW